ncbi:MAG: ParB/RepB/Spo0J family partition protein [Hyphomonadaceae bacterium]
MSELRPRGLGRGLSALLGEPVRTDPPAPANAPAWPAEQQQTEAKRAPVEPPRNVFELPVSNTQQQQPPKQDAAPPQPAAPATPPAAAAPTQPTAIDAGPRSIPIDLVQRNPSQPRKHFDEGDLTELAGSIRTHGVLQPILVRPIPGGKFEIVAGERRWRAAQRAGLHQIPAVVRELNEVEVLEIAIVENVQRTDLNPIEEAQGFQALIDRFGRTQEEIAEAVGKSRPHIANMLRLLKLPEDLQEMVRDGRLSSGHARGSSPRPTRAAWRSVRSAKASTCAKSSASRSWPRTRSTVRVSRRAVRPRSQSRPIRARWSNRSRTRSGSKSRSATRPAPGR